MCSIASTRSSWGSSWHSSTFGGGTSASTFSSSTRTSCRLAAFGGSGARGSGGASATSRGLVFFFVGTAGSRVAAGARPTAICGGTGCDTAAGGVALLLHCRARGLLSAALGLRLPLLLLRRLERGRLALAVAAHRLLRHR